MPHELLKDTFIVCGIHTRQMNTKKTIDLLFIILQIENLLQILTASHHATHENIMLLTRYSCNPNVDTKTLQIKID